MSTITKLVSLSLVFILTTAILTNCHSTRESSKSYTLKKNSGEDFDKFYERFHEDSVFQVSRLKFPVDGMSVKGEEKVKWTRDNLPLLKTKIYDIDTTRFKITFRKTEKMFTQKVWIEDSEFSSEYRFELINKKWYLVYVLDQDL
jgi:hypothetical protein